MAVNLDFSQKRYCMKKFEKNIIKDYEALAPSYEQRWENYLNVGRDWASKIIFPILKHHTRLKVLDVGCGRGVFLKRLHDQFPKHSYCGVDLTKAMLPENQSEIEFIHGSWQDFYEQSHKDKSFDLIVHMNVLHHISNLDLHLQQLKTVLNDDGYILFIDFATHRLPMKMADIYWRCFKKGYYKSYNINDLSDLLGKFFNQKIQSSALRVDHFWDIQAHFLQK